MKTDLNVHEQISSFARQVEALTANTHFQDLAKQFISRMKESTVDQGQDSKEHLVQRLFSRALKASPRQQVELSSTTLGKPSRPAAPTFHNADLDSTTLG